MGSNSADVQIQSAFCPRSPASQAGTFSLKQQRCQLCHESETLNRHSVLYGNDPTKPNGLLSRGQRVFCSNRGQRSGCGRTFSIFLADVLPRHSVRATLLWKLLCQLQEGSSIKAAAQSLGSVFALETFYGLVRRLRSRMDVLRPWLFQQSKPPQCSDIDPLLHTLSHLQSLFAQGPCPLAQFQMAFARPLMG